MIITMSRGLARGRVLIRAGMAIALAFGCRSSGDVREPEAPQVLDAATGVKSDLGAMETDFREEVPAKDQLGIHLDLARAHEVRGDMQAAVYEYARAIESAENPAGRNHGRVSTESKALAHRRMAAALDRLGQFTQAEIHYQEALKRIPDDPRVWNDAGYSSYLQGKWPEAVRRLKTAAKLAPDDPRVQTNLGLCLAAMGRPEDALETLSKAGGPAIGHANLAYVLASTGKTAEARRHYEAALKLRPSLRAAEIALAKLGTEAADRASQIASAPPAPNDDPAVTRASTARPLPALPGE